MREFQIGDLLELYKGNRFVKQPHKKTAFLLHVQTDFIGQSLLDKNKMYHPAGNS